MLSSKKWGIAFLCSVAAALAGLGAVTAVVDPYFHYHGPLKGFAYQLYNERYQNDGIMKHFDYDAIITGTSVTQNFKTSQLNELFGTRAIKVPFPGGSYKEINESLERAVAANPDIRLIVRGLDPNLFASDKDYMNFTPSLYPVYLYDDVPWNDVNYVLNKSILINDTYADIKYTKAGGQTTDFDYYSEWQMELQPFGKEAFAEFAYRERAVDESRMSEEDYRRLQENLEQNVTRLVAANPQIDFYLFFPPYSIFSWDAWYRDGTMRRQLELERETIKTLLAYDNIYLFSFFDEFDMICNLDNYIDQIHYGKWINAQILEWMRNKEHLLTKDNYQEYCDKEYNFYTTYDYDALFESE